MGFDGSHTVGQPFEGPANHREVPPLWGPKKAMPTGRETTATGHAHFATRRAREKRRGAKEQR